MTFNPSVIPSGLRFCARVFSSCLSDSDNMVNLTAPVVIDKPPKDVIVYGISVHYSRLSFPFKRYIFDVKTPKHELSGITVYKHPFGDDLKVFIFVEESVKELSKNCMVLDCLMSKNDIWGQAIDKYVKSMGLSELYEEGNPSWHFLRMK
jgi:hypothetical protein